MSNFLLVFLGGGLGATARYATSLWSARVLGTGFPWGTLVVNLVGCFLIGVLFAAAEKTDLFSHSVRLFLGVGFLGGFTTFSSFGLDTIEAARSGDYAVMALNMLANNIGGILLCGLGILTMRLYR